MNPAEKKQNDKIRLEELRENYLCTLLMVGPAEIWLGLVRILTERIFEKKRQAIYIFLYHVGKYAVRQGFPGKFLEPGQTSTFLLCRTPQCLSMNPQECVT